MNVSFNYTKGYNYIYFCSDTKKYYFMRIVIKKDYKRSIRI